jgi:hypothetical protein
VAEHVRVPPYRCARVVRRWVGYGWDGVERGERRERGEGEVEIVGGDVGGDAREVGGGFAFDYEGAFVLYR